MDDLNKRIIELMIRLELNKSSFAKELNVSLPLITHITAGRNKPGLDIIQKILLTYKQIDPDWLLIGKGEMYRAELKKSDFADIYNNIQKIEGELDEQGKVNNTISKYHKILTDEIYHLHEMTEMIEESTSKTKNIKVELDKIKSELKSK